MNTSATIPDDWNKFQINWNLYQTGIQLRGLPDELFLKIILMLAEQQNSVKSLCNCLQVSKHWNRVCQSPEIWKIIAERLGIYTRLNVYTETIQHLTQKYKPIFKGRKKIAKGLKYLKKISEKKELRIEQKEDSDIRASKRAKIKRLKGAEEYQKKAKDAFLIAAKKAHPLAIDYVIALEKDRTVRKDWETLRRKIIRANMPNCPFPDDAYAIANTFEQSGLAKSLFLDYSESQAVHYSKLAADHGHLKSQYDMGLRYLYGEGVTESAEEAAHYFQLAANQRDRDSQWELGSLYYSGRGVNQSIEQAAHYLNLAAKNGHPEAQDFLKSHPELQETLILEKTGVDK